MGAKKEDIDELADELISELNLQSFPVGFGQAVVDKVLDNPEYGNANELYQPVILAILFKMGLDVVPAPPGYVITKV